MASFSKTLKAMPAWKYALWLVAGVVLIGFPLVFTNPTITQIGIITLVYMACATAWNGFAGFSGYIALGSAVFFGMGAYTFAYIVQHFNMKASSALFLLVPVSGISAGILALAVGAIALRTRKHTFVVITIASVFIFQLLAYNLTSITGGAVGLQVVSPYNWDPATYNNPFYYVALAIFLVAILMMWGIKRSAFGLQLLAIRDDEDRAKGLGVPVWRVKLVGFVLVAIPAGASGALSVYLLGQVVPSYAFAPFFDLALALMALLGGIGTLLGPVVGALVLESVQQYFVLQFSNANLYLILYGVLFLFVMFFMPRGVLPTLGERRKLREARVQLQAVADATAVSAVASEPLSIQREIKVEEVGS